MSEERKFQVGNEVEFEGETYIITSIFKKELLFISSKREFPVEIGGETYIRKQQRILNKDRVRKKSAFEKTIEEKYNV